MRARLGFATALLNNASVLLIDEVLSVGDKDFRARAKSDLEGRFSATRATLLVSHSPSKVNKICTAVIRLQEGCVDKVTTGQL